MATTKPTIFLIHGAWHTPACFSPLTALLKEAGYTVVLPAHPSCPGNASVTLIDDALNVTKELEKVVETQEQDVLVIGHSYGGMVLSEGVLGKFAKKTREAGGKKGGVLRVVYLSAFIMGKGESMATNFVPITGDPTKLPPRTPIDVCARHF
jgi:pimeloyl-ACP methyl ester carboxylesterase